MSTLPASGQMALTAINTTLGRSTRNQLALSDAQMRTLSGIATGQIKLSNFYGKSLNTAVAIFELMFGTSSLPTSDTYGAALNTSGTAPTMINNAVRGYVINLAGSRFLYTNAAFSLTASYTKMAWIYSLVTPNSAGNIISSHNTGNGTHYWWYNNGTQLSAGHSSTGNVNAYITDPSTTPINTWIHFALTYDNPTTTMKLYRNSSNVATVTDAALSWTGSSLQLSVGSFWGSYVFNGYIDNARVYNSALTQSQIAGVYTAELL